MGADSLGEQEYRMTKNVRRAVALSVCLLGACGTAYAQAPVSVDVPEIVTDRPDFTESSEIIPFGWLQIESGVSLEGDAVTRAFTAPSALLRFGLGLRTEFRFGAEGLVSELTSCSKWPRRATRTRSNAPMPKWTAPSPR